MISIMDTISSFKIALTEGPPHDFLDGIDVWIKKNTIILFNTINHNGRSDFSLVTREVTAVNSYFYSFNQLWNSIPPLERDSNWVKQRLLHAISKFKS